MKKIQGVIEQDGEEMAGQVEKLHHALTRFRYEGKLQRGKNLKTLRNIISSLNRDFKKHRKYQEKVLFPFLETHIPKYEATIHFLQSDHAAISKNTQRINASLKLVRRSDRHLDNGNLQEAGTYLVCLLRHHVEFEKNGIQKAMRRDLNEHERIEIKTKIKEWFDCHNERPHTRGKN